jgi:serine/threonine-protein kinase RsbW
MLKIPTILKVPACAEILPIVRAHVKAVAAYAGFKADDIDSIALAASEASANVVEHAFGPDEEGVFEVECRVSSIGLRVIVRDKGLPFAIDQVAKFSSDDVARGKDPEGLGLFLMEKSVDELYFYNLGPNGKEVHLVKHLHTRRVEDYLETSELKAFEKPVHSQKRPGDAIPYHIALMEPSQAIEVSRCAYKAYGYNYIFDYIYYPERIVEMNKRGQLLSALAVADRTGEVMAHAALEMEPGTDKVAEVGVAFTKPQFRNQGCLNRISDYLLDLARKNGVDELYARAVTIHPYSQKAILKHGFKPCGVLVGLAPTALFEEAPEKSRQRESIVLFFLNLSKPARLSLWAPGRHADKLKELYENLGIPVRWNKAGVDAETEEGSLLETQVNKSLNVARINIRRCGRSAAKEVSAVVGELRRRRVDVIHLYLNLREPSCAGFVDDFEAMGFFFAGAMPSRHDNSLILQYLNNVEIDYDKIRTADAAIDKLLSYVKESDMKTNDKILMNVSSLVLNPPDLSGRSREEASL